MSDEPEARMWDEEGPRFESRPRGAYFAPAFASTEHLDRAPLLSEETYTDVPVALSDNEHCHWTQPQPPSAVPQLCIALGLCAVFMVCELIGGYLAGSLSVMCDAAHMLSDCGGFALALLAFHCAKRQPDHGMTYGYKRAEVLGAMVSVLMIWALTAVFVYVAAVRIHTGVYTVEPDMMVAVSGAGVGFNIAMACVLHSCARDIAHHHTHGGASCPHSHSHPSPTHTHTSSFRLFSRNTHKESNGLVNGDYASVEASVVGSTPRNINLRAALIHVIGDLIQSCGVLLASIVIKLYPGAKVVDPICTFVFSVLVLGTSAGVLRDALAMLMQAVPKDFSYESARRALSSACGVRHVHSLHAWSLATHHRVLTAHLAIDELTDPDVVLKACLSIAKNQLQIQSATFQIERYSTAMQRCAECTQMDT